MAVVLSLASSLKSISLLLWIVGFVLCDCLSFHDGSIPSSRSHIDFSAGWVLGGFDVFAATRYVRCGSGLAGVEGRILVIVLLFFVGLSWS